MKQVLFTALVLRQRGQHDCAADLPGPERYGFSWLKPLPHLQVVPTTEVPVMISRDPGGGGYWDHPVERRAPDDAVLRFIDFFDWDVQGYLDFQYYLAAIETCSRHSALAGHQVLIEVRYAKVLADRPAPA